MINANDYEDAPNVFQVITSVQMPHDFDVPDHIGGDPDRFHDHDVHRIVDAHRAVIDSIINDADLYHVIEAINTKLHRLEADYGLNTEYDDAVEALSGRTVGGLTPEEFFDRHRADYRGIIADVLRRPAVKYQRPGQPEDNWDGTGCPPAWFREYINVGGNPALLITG